MHLVYSRKIVVFTLKVLTHRAMGDATLIRNVNKRRENANFSPAKFSCIRLARGEYAYKTREANNVWGSFFCAEGETVESTTSLSDDG